MTEPMILALVYRPEDGNPVSIIDSMMDDDKLPIIGYHNVQGTPLILGLLGDEDYPFPNWVKND